MARVFVSTPETQTQRLEKSHAIVPKYRGGHLIPDNKAELPLPLHAFHHLLIEESCGAGRDKEANRWSVSAIVRRMKPSELEEFNNLVDLHERDRRCRGW